MGRGVTVWRKVLCDKLSHYSIYYKSLYSICCSCLGNTQSDQRKKAWLKPHLFWKGSQAWGVGRKSREPRGWLRSPWVDQRQPLCTCLTTCHFAVEICFEKFWYKKQLGRVFQKQNLGIEESKGNLCQSKKN